MGLHYTHAFRRARKKGHGRDLGISRIVFYCARYCHSGAKRLCLQHHFDRDDALAGEEAVETP